jgi:hypothetical protein
MAALSRRAETALELRRAAQDVLASAAATAASGP